MDVYEDIEKAKKVINYSKFTHMGYNLIYPFTTENLNGYMNKLDFKNKKVLTVGSSADQILNVFLLGCKDITLLDINPFVKYYFDLKVAGLLSLQIEEFLSFFTYNKGLFKNKNSFNHGTFNKIKNYLNENSYIFWNTLYKEYDNCGLIIRKNLFTMDEYKEKVVSLSNNYLRSVENYNLIKSNIENCNPLFLTSDIRNVSNLTKEKYDYIFLSNISSFIEKMYTDSVKGFRKNIYELQNHLNKNGLIYMAYLYDFTNNTKTRPYWDIIHDIDFIKFMFENNTILIEYFTGVNGLEHKNEKDTDAVLIYK